MWGESHERSFVCNKMRRTIVRNKMRRTNVRSWGKTHIGAISPQGYRCQSRTIFATTPFLHFSKFFRDLRAPQAARVCPGGVCPDSAARRGAGPDPQIPPRSPPIPPLTTGHSVSVVNWEFPINPYPQSTYLPNCLHNYVISEKLTTVVPLKNPQ